MIKTQRVNKARIVIECVFDITPTSSRVPPVFKKLDFACISAWIVQWLVLFVVAEASWVRIPVRAYVFWCYIKIRIIHFV